MNAALQFQLTLAALGCSIVALLFSLLAAFPGLKAVLAAVRDGVLWLRCFWFWAGQPLWLGSRCPNTWRAAQCCNQSRLVVALIHRGPNCRVSGSPGNTQFC